MIRIHALPNTIFRTLAVCFSSLGLAASAQAAPITDFVIYGAQTVFIGVGSEVTGLVGSGTAVLGETQLNGAAGIIGDVRSGQDVILGNNSFVTGTVTNPGVFQLGAGATVGAHVVGAPDLPTLPAATVFNHGVTNHTIANGGTLNLAPGAYQNISFGGNGTLNLTAGDYYLGSLSSGNGLDLNINLAGGTTRIYVTEDMNMGSVDVFLTGGTAANVFVETHAVGNNAFRGGGGTDWLGNVFTPYGEIHIGSGSGSGSFVGHLWAGTEVDIEHSITGSAPVPEPATIVLVILGAAMIPAVSKIRRGRRA